MTIGITQSDTNFHHYGPWIKGEDENIEIITLTYDQMNFVDIKKCDGIVLTGGVDTHPKFYNSERLNYPSAPENFNEKRDVFELKVFEYARNNNLPVLAICRGMQLVNCALGGDLIQDLEESGKSNHTKEKNTDRSHEIFVDKNSLLFEVTKTEKGKVNSAHHQGLGKIANELFISAMSEDDVPEAAEYKDKNKPYLLCVQWHPERLMLDDYIVPFSKNIRESFLEAIGTT